MTAPTNDTTEFVWRIEQGERERLVVPIENNGAPFNITGYSIDAKIKTEPGGTVLYTFPAEDVTVDGSTIELIIPGPISAAWTFTVAWWRVVITAPNPDPADPETHLVLKGPFLVERY